MTGTRTAGPQVADTALVAADARVGDGTRVWHHAQVREGASIGRDCVVAKGVYVGAGVVVGDRCKLENYATLFEGLTLEDGVFVGPHACFTNDRVPRAINPDGSLQTAADWPVGRTVVRRGASIGAGAVVLPGVEIGSYAMIGAGAVVTRDVAAHALVVGNPGRRMGFVCVCGRERFTAFAPDAHGEMRCPRCTASEVER